DLAIFVWLTAAAVMLSSTTADGGRITNTAAAALGAGMGVLALTNTSYAVTYPVLLYIALRKSVSRSRRWRLAAEAAAVCFLVILPWTIRNYQAFGRLVS